MEVSEVAIVREQLARLRQSGPLVGTTRVKDLLEYVVEETLAGRAHTLKEYEIARAKFDKRENFDPKQDRIVSTTAGNLRKKLAEYYMHEGAADPCVIDIPKGGFVPTFVFRSGTSMAEPSVPELASEPALPIRSEADHPQPNSRVRKRWIAAGGIAAAMAVIILAFTAYENAYAGFRITVQGDGKTVGSTTDVTVDGWRSGLNHYLMLEPKVTSSYSRERWLQFKIDGPHETRTAQFGQADTPSQTPYRIYVLSTKTELQEGKELDHGKLIIEPPDATESPAVTVTLQK
jgi:hypothetical protein